MTETMHWVRRLIPGGASSLRLGRALRLVWDSSPRWSLASIGLVVLQALVPLAILYLTKLVVDAVAAGVTREAALELGSVLGLIGLAALAGLLGALAGSLSSLVSEVQGQEVTDHVTSLIHGKSVEADLAYYEDPAYHDSLHRAQREAPYRPTRVLSSLLTMAQSGLTAVGIVALLGIVHWLLPILLLAAVVPALVARILHADRAYRWQERRTVLERQASYLSWLLASPAAAKELRAFGIGRTLAEWFRSVRDQLRKEKIALARSRSFGEMGAQTVAATAVFGAYGYIAYRTLDGGLSVGDLVMYFGAVQKGQGLLHSLFTSLGALYEDNQFLALLDDFLELEPKVVAPPDPEPFPRPIRAGIRFEQVAFEYPSSRRRLLHGIDLVLRPGEIVALVGPNGAGKSTMIKLLQRLYDPTEGRITVDGTDLRRFRPADLRREMAVLFQDFMKYSMTVRENVWLGDVERDVDDPLLHDALEAAGVQEVIRHLPEGYDAMLGHLFPEGEELSIGEWQKIALARAFFRDAQVLVVDEPTSALDAEAEAQLFESFRELLHGRAALLVSHRFSTLRMADRIYVLEDGRIVESGSHSELIMHGGRYAQLYRLQASAYTEVKFEV